jgi:hypothetical protein
VRRPGGAFGWLDARLLHERWLERLTPEATTVLVLLALAADRRGASYYGRERMAALVGLDRRQVDQALDLLRALGLVDHRPWRPGHPDGVWQLLPLPPAPRETRGGEPASLASILAALARDPGPGEPPRT